MNTAAGSNTAKIAFDNFKGVKPLLSVYTRLCPKDQLTENDPRFPCIAAEMVAVGRAPDAETAFEVIRWWDSDEGWARTFVRDARRSLCRMKLERFVDVTMPA
ncbi:MULTISPECIES: hypothetical protein [Achromobacter]|uniref:hypothetical protein n=1 Tax=Achromobacter TaxID=222 RepID=UPI0023F6F3FD|nr:hypothetical protein [Achromobacter anxifer]MDF8362046.1 hypothetical protein [Achromobacter anxifer]